VFDTRIKRVSDLNSLIKIKLPYFFHQEDLRPMEKEEEKKRLYRLFIFRIQTF
jgi:hypothetical protein